MLLLKDFGIEQEIVTLKPNKELQEFGRDIGIQILVFNKKIRFKLAIRSSSGMRELNLAHGYQSSLFALFLNRLNGSNYMIAHHHQPNFFHYFRERAFFRSAAHLVLVKLTYKYSVAIQSFSIEVTEFLGKCRVPTEKIFINPLGMNINKISKIGKDSTNSPRPIQHEKVIVSIGRLSWEKNYELAIKSIGLAIKKGQRFQYHIYGEGPLRNSIRDLISKLELDEFITLKGFDLDVLEKIQNADLFLHTSLTESYGQVVFEAYTLGLPILTSRVGVGIDLNKQDSERVQFLDPDSQESVANQIGVILSRDSANERNWKIDYSVLQIHSIKSSVANLVNFLNS